MMMRYGDALAIAMLFDVFAADVYFSRHAI